VCHGWKLQVNRVLFADDLVLVSFTESDLQRASNDFAAARDNAVMKISTSKTKVLPSFEKPWSVFIVSEWSITETVEKFKYLGVVFTSDRRQDEELDIRMRKFSVVT